MKCPKCNGTGFVWWGLRKCPNWECVNGQVLDPLPPITQGDVARAMEAARTASVGGERLLVLVGGTDLREDLPRLGVKREGETVIASDTSFEDDLARLFVRMGESELRILEPPHLGFADVLGPLPDEVRDELELDLQDATDPPRVPTKEEIEEEMTEFTRAKFADLHLPEAQPVEFTGDYVPDDDHVGHEV